MEATMSKSAMPLSEYVKQNPRAYLGVRVTGEPRYWHDGTPISGWPNPQYVGTVIRRVRTMGGMPYAWVQFDSGRKDVELVGSLSVIITELEPTPPRSAGGFDNA